MSSSLPSSTAENHLQAEDLPNPVSVGAEKDTSSESASSNTGSSCTCSLDHDYGYEPYMYLAVNASLLHDRLESDYVPGHQDVLRGNLSKSRKKKKTLKAIIEHRKTSNQRFRARIAQIEKCKKYAATLKKLEQELNADRAETHVLEDSMMQAIETMDYSVEDWAELAHKWVFE
ncbi:hypothetical protein B0T13DRAFT_81556 [Neurospora crassa]|nr:hypothetical protein B0T13DRAFT_81556 [Neurospora crassa]